MSAIIDRECENEQCRFNKKTDYKIPCQDCRNYLRSLKAQNPKKKIKEVQKPKPKKCRSCEQLSSERVDGMCQECITCKDDQIAAYDSYPHAQTDVLFVMKFDQNGKKINYRGFTKKNTQSELENYLIECIGSEKCKKIDKICGLDVHRVYNTGGAPLDTNNVYIPILKNCSSTLRVLISFMNSTTYNLRVNVQRYAETAFKEGAIDLCFLVFQKMDNKIVLPHDNSNLIKEKHGTKAGILLILKEICEASLVGLADDDERRNCLSTKRTFEEQAIVVEVPKIEKGGDLGAWVKQPEALENVRTIVSNYIKNFI